MRALSVQVAIGVSLLTLALGSSMASAASEGSVAVDPLQELNAQERAVWDSTIGYFLHAYVQTPEGEYAPVPELAYKYILGVIKWHSHNNTVTAPEAIKKLEEKLARAKAGVNLGGTFTMSDEENRHQQLLREQIADLERELAAARTDLRTRCLAFSQGDLVTLEALNPALLEKYEVGEVGALDGSFTVKLIKDQTTALALISRQHESFWISLEGWPTGELVTDRRYTLEADDRTGVVTGTRGYEMADAGAKTALVIERVEAHEYLAGITQAQFIEVLQAKGMTPKAFTHLVYQAHEKSAKNYVTDVLRQLEASVPEDGGPAPSEDGQAAGG